MQQILNHSQIDSIDVTTFGCVNCQLISLIFCYSTIQTQHTIVTAQPSLTKFGVRVTGLKPPTHTATSSYANFSHFLHLHFTFFTLTFYTYILHLLHLHFTLFTLTFYTKILHFLHLHFTLFTPNFYLLITLTFYTDFLHLHFTLFTPAHTHTNTH